MMRLKIYSLLLLFFACKHKESINIPNQKTTMSFDWMLGFWQRSNDKMGHQTYETWSKQNDTLYTSLGYTMQAQDTVWRENVKLFKRDTSWFFSVLGKGETESTDFMLTTITYQSFICENPNNEFPKMIMYHLKGDSLIAKISGGGPDIEFKFGKRR